MLGGNFIVISIKRFTVFNTVLLVSDFVLTVTKQVAEQMTGFAPAGFELTRLQGRQLLIDSETFILKLPGSIIRCFSASKGRATAQRRGGQRCS